MAGGDLFAMAGSLPAKVMLFGEYGVLLGYPAASVTLPTPRLELSVRIRPAPAGAAARATLRSAFIPDGECRVVLEPEHADLRQAMPELPPTAADLARLSRAALPGSTRDERFLTLALLPWLTHLAGLEVDLEVHRAFSPALGFGSSSALLGLIHRALFGFVYPGEPPLPDERFWQRLRTSLRLLQGDGSGYDVAVQLAAGERTDPMMWRYRWQPGGDTFVPQVTALGSPPRDLGCLLATDVYADTTACIGRFLQAGRSELDRARAHGELAERFLVDPSSPRTARLMDAWRAIAADQGLLGPGDGPLDRLARLLTAHSIPFKGTGAGHGDCLWLLTDPEQLEALIHPVTGRPLSERVVAALSISDHA